MKTKLTEPSGCRSAGPSDNEILGFSTDILDTQNAHLSIVCGKSGLCPQYWTGIYNRRHVCAKEKPFPIDLLLGFGSPITTAGVALYLFFF